MRIICIIILIFSTLVYAEESPSTFDSIYDSLTFYENQDNSIIQSFAFKGRLQADAVAFRSDDSTLEDLDWRRIRAGFKAGIFKDFTLHSEVDFDGNDLDNFYNRMTDAYIGWSTGEEVKVKLGKQSVPFTLDGSTSSTKLLTPERSIVADNLWFTTTYFTGTAGYGEINDWSWRAGVYSSSGDDEFGEFDSGGFGLISLGKEFCESSSLRLDYVYNDPDFSGNVGTRNLQHVVSLVYKLQEGRVGFWADLSVGKGLAGQSDMLGIELMPFYDIFDKWQLVFRYAGVYVTESTSGVRLGRYPQRVAGSDVRADTMHDFLAGINWLIYGHKVKWQNAVEYNYGTSLSDGSGDYNGWGVTSAIRISW